MKRILAWLFIMNSILIMGSCEYEEVDLGFPKSITFKNKKFKYGIPIIIILQVCLVVYLHSIL